MHHHTGLNSKLVNSGNVGFFLPFPRMLFPVKLSFLPLDISFKGSVLSTTALLCVCVCVCHEECLLLSLRSHRY